MRIKCSKNGLKTCRYETRPEWDVPLGAPLAMECPIGCPIGQTENLTFFFGLKGHPTAWIIPYGSSHCVSLVKIMRSGYTMKGDDPDGSPHFVPIQFFMYLRFEIYQNTSKYSQIVSN